MKSLLSSRTAAATLALLTALTLSSCGGSKQESASNTSTTAPADTTAVAPNTASTTVPQTTQGVAPEEGNCPSGNPIKGISSKRLGKIALTSKSPDYKTAKAEKCFADSAAAKLAGYAVPK